jgi:hypothetical protein
VKKEVITFLSFACFELSGEKIKRFFPYTSSRDFDRQDGELEMDLRKWNGVERRSRPTNSF